MKKSFSLVLILIATLLTHSLLAQRKTDPANFERYAEANTSVQPGGIVFMGNSITEGWAGQRPEFFSGNKYTCRGISGQTTSQMLVRFRQDVINLKPKAVVILAGINDIAQNTGYISLENILGNIMSMAELAKANGIKPILCSVLPAAAFPWRREIQPADSVIQLNSMIRAFAQKNKFTYVDYHTILKDEHNGLSANHASDGVHPTAACYAIMEGIVKPVIDKAIGRGKKMR